MTRIKKAVFPVAGLGSRFLPATKAQPKEMLPIVDKPLIQYAVEEAYEAGIRHMIFVTGRNKRAIEDHFDKAYELETELERKNKDQLLGAGADRFLHRVLDQRLVDDRQHLLGAGLGGRQRCRFQAGEGAGTGDCPARRGGLVETARFGQE